MKPEANINRVILGLKRAIEKKFDKEKWLELGYLTDSIDLITNHPRLLRSLSWGDDDYGQCIFEVLPRIIGKRREYLATVAGFVGLEEWLLENDVRLLEEIYGRVASRPSSTAAAPPDGPRLFICHASEDKDDFVRPLASLLREHGVIVWYDEFTLRLGDSLRRSIDKGLSQSDFGVVVLSPAFFAKEWPQYELDGLIQRELDGQKVILPVWHKVSHADVLRYSPALAGRLAARSESGTTRVVQEILEAIASPSLLGDKIL
jgi:hypothetical protein